MSGAQPTAQGYPGKFTLAHHFDTPAQQFDSGKFAMWLFLVTEILLFGGLFCAYAVYRASHPDVFLFAHTFLNKQLGAVNTVVLLFSSFTMAWAVRAAQLGQRRLLSGLLTVTLLCGFVFLGIKGIEYNEKWKHGLLWGENFDYTALEHAMEHGEEGAAAHGNTDVAPETAGSEAAGTEAAENRNVPAGERPLAEGYREPAFRSSIEQSALAPGGLAAAVAVHAAHGTLRDIPRNVHIFFGIYFTMTGLHGLHVIAGMIVLAWLLRRSLRGDFGTRNFAAVDFGGLYWHLVDLIWIFLFPLLYLIH
jgi:cytochrome c oxidase subunit 3